MKRRTNLLALLLRSRQICYEEEAMDIRTVVVPVDFSKYSEKAFTWALALAEKWRSLLRGLFQHQ